MFSDQSTSGSRSAIPSSSRPSLLAGDGSCQYVYRILQRVIYCINRRCGRRRGPRCDKGNPAVRRVRKATDLSEAAGLPNRRNMRRHTGYLAVAAISRPAGSEARQGRARSRSCGPNRSTRASGQIPIRYTAPPARQKWPSSLREMAGWHIAIPFQRNHNKHWEGSANTLALRKGNPAARRARKATGLSETAGLPNRGSLCAATSGF